MDVRNTVCVIKVSKSRVRYSLMELTHCPKAERWLDQCDWNDANNGQPHAKYNELLRRVSLYHQPHANAN